jgi:tetratricopeptide (TPR) repeat protein
VTGWDVHSAEQTVLEARVMAKRINRKQLLKEPDQFLTLSGRILATASQYKKPILWGSTGFFSLIILIALFNFISSRAEAKAFALLDQAESRYETLVKQKGAAEAAAAVTTEYEKILDEYAGKAGGKMARVLFGDICYRGGQTDRAIALYTEALDDFSAEPLYRNRIRTSLAHALLARQDDSAAAGYFEQVTLDPEATVKDEALFHLGALYAKMGQADKSRSAYEKLVSDYKDSIYLELAKDRIRK